jgi:hypothetical protein
MSARSSPSTRKATARTATGSRSVPRCPGPTDSSPVIDAASASVTSDDGLTWALHGEAHDPEGDPLTYSWQVAGPNGFSATPDDGADSTVTVPAPGKYTATLTVSDGALATPDSFDFIAVGGTDNQYTDIYRIPIPPPGTYLPDLPPAVRAMGRYIDGVINGLVIYDTLANLANYDPAEVGRTTLFVCEDVEALFISDGTSWVYAMRPPSMGSTGLSAGEATMRRFDVDKNDFVTTASGTLRFTYFEPIKTEPITQLRILTGSTTAAGLTLAKLGVYSEDPATGDLTLVASTANLGGSTWNTPGSSFTHPLQATWNKARGIRYAIANLAVGTTPPTFQGHQGPTNALEMGQSPRLCATLTGQSDLPSTVTAASLVNASDCIYIVTVP